VRRKTSAEKKEGTKGSYTLCGNKTKGKKLGSELEKSLSMKDGKKGNKGPNGLLPGWFRGKSFAPWTVEKP